jgi:hypothetical protein
MGYILKDSYETNNDLLSLGSTSNVYKSGSFIAGSSYTATKISLPFIGVGTPVNDLNLYIYSDDGGANNGKPLNLLATSTSTVSMVGLTGSTTWLDFLFAGQALTNGVKYHIVPKASGVDASNYARWIINNAEANNATCLSANGSSWSSNDATSQGNFRIYETSSGGFLNRNYWWFQ